MLQMSECFLAVPTAEVENILVCGYRPIRRRGVRVSLSAAEAILAFRRRHSSSAACLRFVPAPRARWTVSRGGHVLDCDHIPAQQLTRVEASAIEYQTNCLHTSLYLAVCASDLQSILRNGYLPRHRTSVPVSVSAERAREAYARKHRGRLEAVVVVNVEAASAAGCRVVSHDNGIDILLPTPRWSPRQTLPAGCLSRTVVDAAGAFDAPPVAQTLAGLGVQGAGTSRTGSGPDAGAGLGVVASTQAAPARPTGAPAEAISIRSGSRQLATSAFAPTETTSSQRCPQPPDAGIHNPARSSLGIGGTAAVTETTDVSAVYAAPPAPNVTTHSAAAHPSGVVVRRPASGQTPAGVSASDPWAAAGSDPWAVAAAVQPPLAGVASEPVSAWVGYSKASRVNNTGSSARLVETSASAKERNLTSCQPQTSTTATDPWAAPASDTWTVATAAPAPSTGLDPWPRDTTSVGNSKGLASAAASQCKDAQVVESPPSLPEPILADCASSARNVSDPWASAGSDPWAAAAADQPSSSSIAPKPANVWARDPVDKANGGSDSLLAAGTSTSDVEPSPGSCPAQASSGGSDPLAVAASEPRVRVDSTPLTGAAVEPVAAWAAYADPWKRYAPRPDQTFTSGRQNKVVRCFAAFACRDCPGATGHHFEVLPHVERNCRGDPRIGTYHFVDEMHGKPVYKRYGSRMYVYLVSGSDLTIGGRMYDKQDYTHAGSPVFKARGEDLYLFYECYDWDAAERLSRRGRWLLTRHIATVPDDIPLANTPFLAYADSQSWAWPSEGMMLHGIRAADWSSGISFSKFHWAFGGDPAGDQHLEQVQGPETGDVPVDGWDDVWIRFLPRQRYFESSIVMARRVDGSVEHETPDVSPVQFDFMREGSHMYIKLRAAVGADQCSWTRAVVITGGRSARTVRVQVKKSRFSAVYEDLMLDSPRVEGFKHPDECTTSHMRELQQQEVLRLHSCLAADGRLLLLPSGLPPKRAGLHLGETKYVRRDFVLRGQVPMNQPANFWREFRDHLNQDAVPTQTNPPPWTTRCKFEAVNSGLETTFTFRGVEIGVRLEPHPFALEEPVFQLGQRARNTRGSKHSMFDAAFKLLNDRRMHDESPQNLAEALLLFNSANECGNDGDPTAELAASAAASASLLDSMQDRLSSVNRRAEQRNGIANLLMDQYGVHSEPIVRDPMGWVRFPIERQDDWPGDRCYHGTSAHNMVPVLLAGLRLPRGRDDIAHGASGSSGVPTIYCSPSWHYAAHPVYSPLHRGPKWPHVPEAFQMVFECAVQPGTYKKQAGTLGNKHWDRDIRIDPDRPTLRDLEYLVTDPVNIRLTGVLFRMFGRDIDEDLYDSLPKSLNVPLTDSAWRGDGPRDGVEYKWTGLLQKDYKARGLFLS
ncbi:unnamed protein product [Prorocentrum cordatum]|uniref:Uncharacterized protein n=1 Tax=Prorocentrum cordatum TaxID=2364126 RepID=A0ABN9XCA0_9DINO|nr:unnamed protein product [Polarella glacialis]